MTKRAEEITLQDLRKIDSSCLVDFGSPFISHLTLEGCTQITDVGVIAVLKKCTNVRVLNISWLHQLTDESITVLAKKLNFKLVRECTKYTTSPNVSYKLIVDMYATSFHAAEMTVFCSGTKWYAFIRTLRQK